MCVGVAETGVEHCSPAKNHKETFLVSYFCMTKSTKSHIRGLSSLLYISSRVHELVARAMRGKCVRQRTERKSAVLPLPIVSYYHACEHITRKIRADSCTHCLHARYKCKVGINTYAKHVCWRRRGGASWVWSVPRCFASLLQWGIDRFAEQMRSASPRLGAEGVSRRLTDEVLS